MRLNFGISKKDSFYKNDETDVIQIDFAYSEPQSDGSSRTRTVGIYYVIQKDPYNVIFKDLDSNGNIIPGVDGTMYRMYNANSGEHFYTADVGEANYILSIGWNYEWIGWYSASYGQPLYRLYNPNATGAGSHHYTTKVTERDWLVSSGWNYEGIGWYGL